MLGIVHRTVTELFVLDICSVYIHIFKITETYQPSQEEEYTNMKNILTCLY